jgi:uncharacterized membrane protein YfcA
MISDMLAFGSGALVGFVLGLIGGGGSVLAVPLLVYVVGVKSPHIAIGTSAIAVALSAFFNLIQHARARNVKWQCASVFAIAGVAGAFLGSSIGISVAAMMPGTTRKPPPMPKKPESVPTPNP